MPRRSIRSSAPPHSGKALLERLVELGEVGYRTPREAFTGLIGFRDSAVVRSLPTRGRNKLDQLMPSLLEAAALAIETLEPSCDVSPLHDALAALVQQRLAAMPASVRQRYEPK